MTDRRSFAEDRRLSRRDAIRLVGAAAGCLYGRHRAKEKARERKRELQLQRQRDTYHPEKDAGGGM